MENVAAKITTKAFYLERLMRHKVIEGAELGKEISLLHLEVLGIIVEQKGITMKELANKLKIAAPSATSLANKLVNSEYIKRVHDSNNRRLVRLEVTSSGAAVYDASIKKSQLAVTEILSVLTESDQRDLLRIYEVLISSLQ